MASGTAKSPDLYNSGFNRASRCSVWATSGDVFDRPSGFLLVQPAIDSAMLTKANPPKKKAARREDSGKNLARASPAPMNVDETRIAVTSTGI